jgi:hypothetical protein
MNPKNGGQGESSGEVPASKRGGTIPQYPGRSVFLGVGGAKKYGSVGATQCGAGQQAGLLVSGGFVRGMAGQSELPGASAALQGVSKVQARARHRSGRPSGIQHNCCS